MGAIASSSGQPHYGAWLLTASQTYRAGPKGTREGQRPDHTTAPVAPLAWRRGGRERTVGEALLETGGDPGHRGARPGPRGAPRPSLRSSPSRFRLKGWALSPRRRTFTLRRRVRSASGLGSPVRLHRLPPVPWMPRSSPCWPSCWLRSASATVSALGGGGWAGARLPAPGSMRGRGASASSALP